MDKYCLKTMWWPPNLKQLVTTKNSFSFGSGTHNTFDCQIWKPGLWNPELSYQNSGIVWKSGIRGHMGLGIHSGNTKSTALKTEFKIAYVERCMRWYKPFHNSCKFKFHFTGLLRVTFNSSDYTDFMRGHLTEDQNWKQSRGLCQNSSEGDLESIEEKNEQIFVESIITKISQQ